MPKQHLKKTSKDPKTSKKVDKTVKFADKSNKDRQMLTRLLNVRLFKTSNKNNTASNAVSEIQTSDLDQNTKMKMKMTLWAGITHLIW